MSQQISIDIKIKLLPVDYCVLWNPTCDQIRQLIGAVPEMWVISFVTEAGVDYTTLGPLNRVLSPVYLGGDLTSEQRSQIARNIVSGFLSTLGSGWHP